MSKSIFTEKQPEVRHQIDDYIYITICLNEEEIETEEGIQYQYDFNHIILPAKETTLLDRIISNPAKYINYKYTEISQIDQMQAQIDYLMEMI